MAADPLTLALVALGIVIGVVGLLIYVTRRVRKRSAQLGNDLAPSPRYRDDQAYNQVRLAKAEMDILTRQGYDVSGPKAKLSLAEQRLDRHDYDGALEYAGAAHETLVVLRSNPAQALAPAPVAPIPVRSAPAPSPSGATATDRAPGPKLEKNQAESRFQLTLLVDDLARARKAHPGDPVLEAGAKGLSDAQLAFTKGEYTEALRVALKTRRSLGIPVEGLPPSARSMTTAPTGDPATEPTAAAASKPSSCPRCGRPVQPSDQFCRSCGAPRGSAPCPRCGAPASGDDAYCGVCGAPMT